MRVETFIIPYPTTAAGRKDWSRRYGLNTYYSGVPWPVRKKNADYWHRLVTLEMDRQKVRKKPFEKPVIITFYWNSRLDIDNNAITGKMITDAMKGRIITDDNRRWVKGVEHYFSSDDFIKVVVRTTEQEANG